MEFSAFVCELLPAKCKPLSFGPVAGGCGVGKFIVFALSRVMFNVLIIVQDKLTRLCMDQKWLSLSPEPKERSTSIPQWSHCQNSKQNKWFLALDGSSMKALKCPHAAEKKTVILLKYAIWSIFKEA